MSTPDEHDQDDRSADDREELLADYLDQLPYDPYPVQEDALLKWFGPGEGVLVCAPTGTGKTLIAEAAMFEALKTGKTAYYTTPLIALTDQKFEELQDAAEEWGFDRDQVGLVTGNRRVNPKATILVVVAEILVNRLLNQEAFDFSNVSAVVMDEFHSFNDSERGIVWELSLGLLPKHVRLLLLSATVGNAVEFLGWLRNAHGRKLALSQGTERKVPLSFHWIDEELLAEQLELMAEGEGEARMTPALVFCFNRNECWDVAEQLKGRHLVDKATQKKLADALEEYDLSTGAGPKLKRVLVRGVGIHHAGIVPRYRKIVEELFQQKLLSVCVCTETLAAGMNLPARSVVLTTLLKGPSGKKKLVETSSAQQMFGRAGRPQYDTQGHVYAIAHEDDVKILRAQRKYEEIPEDTKDPLVLKAKKRLKKKIPTRRSTEQYWSEAQFEQLQNASPAKLASRGPMPWRLLAHLLSLSPEVDRLKTFLKGRLLTPKERENGEKQLVKMLRTLHAGEYVRLEPEPPPPPSIKKAEPKAEEKPADPEPETGGMLLGALLAEANVTPKPKKKDKANDSDDGSADEDAPKASYEPVRAIPTARLHELLAFRSVNPLYGSFLLQHFEIADEEERLQLLESVLEMPRSIRGVFRFPSLEELPRGPLAETRFIPELLDRGVVTQEEIIGNEEAEKPWERRDRMAVGEMAFRMFQSEFSGVHGVRVSPIWCAGELFRFGGDFDKYVRARDLVKQEGMIFRHLLRLILLCGEFQRTCPAGWEFLSWQEEMRSLADRLTESCRAVDPVGTDQMIATGSNTIDPTDPNTT